MKKKLGGIVVCILFVFSVIFPVMGSSNNIDEISDGNISNQYFMNEYEKIINHFLENPSHGVNDDDKKGLEMTGTHKVEKCTCDSGEDEGKPGDRRVYKYTLKNNGDIPVKFDHITITFLSNHLDTKNCNSPIGFTASASEYHVQWDSKKSQSLTPGGSIGNMVVRTTCYAQDKGGADAIPTAGTQKWWVQDLIGKLPSEKTKFVGEGDVQTKDVTPKVEEKGTSYNPEHPAEDSCDKNHNTYAKTTGESQTNWIIYDLGDVRRFDTINIFPSTSPEYCNPEAIRLYVGTEDNGICDQIVGIFQFPPAANSEMVEANLDNILEKRYVKVSFLSKWNEDESHGPPIGAEIAEVEFPSFVNVSNQFPTTPSKPTGYMSCEIGEVYQYTTSSSDPDGDDIWYFFDWGDDTNSSIGPYPSGEEVTVEHQWTEEGNYDIKVKVMDEHYAESNWSEPLTVSMPKPKVFITPFLRFLENYPLLFPILRLVLDLT
jgi:hypothetical protein